MRRIIERLRRKYVKPILCAQCGKNLDARVAIGVGGMACPLHHGAWVMRKLWGKSPHASRTRRRFTMSPSAKRLLSKLVNSSKIYVTSIRRKSTVPIAATDLMLKLRLSPGAEGLAGMACPNRHGAWIDQNMLEEIRRRLDSRRRRQEQVTKATGPLPCELSLRAAEQQPIWL